MNDIILVFFFLWNCQAYAELEKDTPGTIFGITQKTDGKSKTSSSSFSEKTQGEHDDKYEPHDKSGDEQYQSKQYENQRFWKIFGITLVIALAYVVVNKKKEYNSSIMTDLAAHQYGIKTEEELRKKFKDV